MKHNKRAIAKQIERIEAQTAHVERMVAHDPTSPSIKAARLILLMLKDELAHLEAGGTAATFDVFANQAARVKAVR